MTSNPPTDPLSVLRRQSTHALTLNVAGLGLTVATGILLARILGAGAWGVYSYTLAWLGILDILSRLGLDTTLVRFVAGYRAREEWGRLRGLLGFSSRAVIVSGVVLALAAVGVVQLTARGAVSESGAALIAGAVAVPILGLAALRQGALRGLKLVAAAVAPEVILRPVLISAGVVALYLAGYDVTARMAVVVAVGAILASFVTGAILLARHLPAAVRTAHPVRRVREWLEVSVPMTLVAGMQVLLARSDVVMIGLIEGPLAAGIYVVAVRLSVLSTFGLDAVNAISPALISESHADGTTVELQRTLTGGASLILRLTIPIVIGLAVFGRIGLGLFGPEFTQGYVALLILLGGQTTNALTGSVLSALTMTGHQRTAARLTGITLGLNIGLNAILIPILGLNGAAIATSSTVAFRNLAAWVIVRRRLDLDPSALSLLKRRRG